MSNIFFSSDNHYGHNNIIKYSNRPFKTTEEMDETMIANWNSVVSESDTVYHVGDFAMSDGGRNPEKYFRRLNGFKHLIKGNHDYDYPKVLELPWESVQDMKVLKFGKQKIVLMHYAMRVWWHSYKGAWQLYGHSHCTLPEQDNLSFDIGVDAWNFFPVSLEQIRKKMQWKQNNLNYFKDIFKNIPESEIKGENASLKTQNIIQNINSKFY